MTEFWEEAFKGKQAMWGFEPAKSAVQTAELFADKGFEKVLIPGIGYGRNATPFIEKGMEVTGIEISETAIGLAEEYYGKSLQIHFGSVTDMPFDNHLYDGIFCYALIHLLDEQERRKLIADCHRQLAENGIMVFTTISKKAQTYGQGTLIGKDRYEQFGGVKMYFYDTVAIQEEFGRFGSYEVVEINENYPFHLIICEKDGNKGVSTF